LKNKIKVGLIGSGFVGQVAHISSLHNLKNVKIVALSELRNDLGLKVCKKYNIEKFYNNFEDMLAENKLDLVVAIVRRYHTAGVALKVLAKGFNLFTEKPMAPSYQQAKKLLHVSKKKKVSYVIGNMRRFDEGINYVHKVLKNKSKLKKELGEILNFRSYCYAGNDYCNIDGDIKTSELPPTNSPNPKFPLWIKSKKEGWKFEKFLNYFSHDINLIRYFFGEKFKIKTIMKKNNGNVIFDYGNFYGIFDYIYSDNKIWREGFEINFSKGSIIIDLPPAFLKNQPSKVKICYHNGLKKVFEPIFDWSWSFKNQTKQLINIISNKKKSISSAEDSIKDLELIERIWKSRNS